MMKQALGLAPLALSAGACAVEHRTVVVADDPCTSYGFTASSADYARCQPCRAARRPTIVAYRTKWRPVFPFDRPRSIGVAKKTATASGPPPFFIVEE